MARQTTKLERALLEACRHFDQRGYPDALLFVFAAMALPHDPQARLAQAALEAFEAAGTFASEDVEMLDAVEQALAEATGEHRRRR